MKKCLEKNGITLIALMISIIILLILAGVSLNLAMGENGIIGRAISAREQHEASSEKELIELAVSAAMVDGQGTITTENLNKELKEQFGNENEVNPTSVGWNYNSNKRYRIYKNGKLEENFLPDNYQQVEYIESTGTQYIDTTVIGKPGLKTFLKITTPNIVNPIDQNVLGCVDNNSFRIYPLALYNGKWRYGFNELYENSSGELNGNTTYIIETYLGKSEQYLKVNNETLVTSNKSYDYSTQLSMFLFARNRRSYAGFFFQGKIYYCQIFNESEKVRDFIPCYSATTVADINGNNCPSGTIGMYDLVENKFYTNSGSGTFLKGPDV